MYKEDLSGLLFLIKCFEEYQLNKVGIIVETLYLLAMHSTYYNRDKDGIRELCSYVVSSHAICEITIKGYFMILEYRKCILDFGTKFGYIDNINSMKSSKKFINRYSGFGHVDDNEILALVKKNNERSDYFLFDAVESADGEEGFEEYFTCNNNIIYNLMSLYTEITHNYEKIDFMTKNYLDVILPEHRENFCKNLIKEIFNLGYNYIEFGFYDLWHSGNNQTNCLAQNYERIAFNLVFNRYLTYVNQICFWKVEEKIKYSGLWGLTYYESFDVSINDKNLYEQYGHSKVYSCEELENNITENEYIRINGTSDGKISTYIANKEESITLGKIKNAKDNFIEGVYYSELFLSDGFFKYFELLDKDEKIMATTKYYLWDYKPFTNFSIINPLICKEAQLSISEDKMQYYSQGEQVCINTIKQSGFDEFLIKVDFLSKYLISNNYKIIWIFNDLQKNENLVIQYDGINIIK